MNGSLLAVDTNLEVFHKLNAAWSKQGFILERVSSMQAAIEKLSKKQYTIVGINADNIHYNPLLNIMREFTDAPIHVMTSNHTMAENTEAVILGANHFLQWPDDADESVRRGLAFIQSFMDYRNRAKPTDDFVLYRSIFVFPRRRKAFMKDREVPLTPTEFELLWILARNHHQTIVYDRILEFIRSNESNENAFDAMQAHIRRLRNKLIGDADYPVYIKNVHNIGYVLQ